ncbi:MAG: CatB-related O-acetyltransferase [Bacteroidota bacterium]|nr:CatB-related O-acetyltransferase [Bacteroidota bacterium]
MTILKNIIKYGILKSLYFEIIKIKLLYKFKKKDLILELGSNLINSNVGFRVYIGEGTILTNSFIDDFSYVNSNSKIKNTVIGKFCSIGPGVKIVLGSHPLNFVSTHPNFYSNNKPFKTFSDQMHHIEFANVIIGNDVWIGEDTLIPGGVEIGTGAVILSRSVVTKNVEPYSVVGGVPAKIVKFRFDTGIINDLLESKWWDRDINWLKENTNYFRNPTEFIKLFNNKVEI